MSYGGGSDDRCAYSAQPRTGRTTTTTMSMMMRQLWIPVLMMLLGLTVGEGEWQILRFLLFLFLAIVSIAVSQYFYFHPAAVADSTPIVSVCCCCCCCWRCCRWALRWRETIFSYTFCVHDCCFFTSVSSVGLLPRSVSDQLVTTLRPRCNWEPRWPVWVWNRNIQRMK